MNGLDLIRCPRELIASHATGDVKPLPPFGKKYLIEPHSAGLCVAVGATAWRFARRKPFPVLVLPREDWPSNFRWPAHPDGAIVFECGTANDHLLTAMAAELLVVGCPYVVAIREALVCSDPRVFFYAEVSDGAG